ncbi:E3 ubiquitin-protein ligase TRIM31 [Elephas maximus indicus]|uniref:E3 ubiquitin-protein ligase TRIM31 n=1 Tax=Elephas maximus indicus TaxID=99487 RepID=UPI002116FAE6|nr:E3 ubiquitin-protein ligase TRIM31 [Elephas maximus indicus]
MASPQFVSNLQEEVICPICIDILQDAVTIDCGHSFCLSCISWTQDPSDGLLKCPLCKKSVRKDTLRPNWLLMNLVEKIQAMSPLEAQPEREEPRCQKHQEKIHYFCEHDGKFLCTVCRDSQDHKSHKANLIEEAAPKYQGLIQLQLKDLQQKEKMIVEVKAQGERKIDVFKAQVEHEKQRIIREFKHLRQVLEEEEKFLLLRLDWLAQEGENGGHFFGTSTEAQLNSLNRLVDFLKAKQQMSPREMLSGIKVVLYRSRGFQFLQPTAVSPDLEKKLSEAKSRHDSITETLKKFRDNLQADGKKDKSRISRGMSGDLMKSWILLENNNSKLNKTSKPESTSPAPPPALLQARNRMSFAEVPQSPASSENSGSAGSAWGEELKVAPTPVTLDAASAHPDLVLSPDLKTVALDFVPPGDSEEPAHPECFYPFRCVLGSPGFSSGRQAWEVELGGAGGGACVVGVASEHAARRGFLAVEPRAGFWALRIAGPECQALIEANTREELPARTNRVGVCVDHERGEVVFYDAITSQHIYTFQACFPGRIFPFFRLLFPGTKITLSP